MNSTEKLLEQERSELAAKEKYYQGALERLDENVALVQDMALRLLVAQAKFAAVGKCLKDNPTAHGADIWCPECHAPYIIASAVDHDLMTTHGSDGPLTVECRSCNHRFLVREHVYRCYEVSDLGEEYQIKATVAPTSPD